MHQPTVKSLIFNWFEKTKQALTRVWVMYSVTVGNICLSRPKSMAAIACVLVSIISLALGLKFSGQQSPGAPAVLCEAPPCSLGMGKLAVNLMNANVIDFSSLNTFSDTQLREVVETVRFNETSGRLDELLSWNQHEAFPSLGIGHFLWFPKEIGQPYDETFPTFVQFAGAEINSDQSSSQSKIEMPEWLKQKDIGDFPWNRKEFLKLKKNRGAHKELSRFKKFKSFVVQSIDLQAQFIITRIERALYRVLATDRIENGMKNQEVIKRNIETLIQTQKGLTALADYINFKGLGVNPVEVTPKNKYAWGIRQVLTRMDSPSSFSEALPHFTESAKRTLGRRVNDDRRMKKFWGGWQRRLQRYL